MSPSKPRQGSRQRRRKSAAIESSIEQFRAGVVAVDQSRIDGVSDTLPVDSKVCPRGPIKFGKPRQKGTRPVQGVVDRAVPLALPTFEVQVTDPDTGKLLETLVFPISPPGRFGADVNDPAGFSRLVDPRTSICAILDPTSAIYCLARGGAW